jgi:hypothetical protein
MLNFIVIKLQILNRRFREESRGDKAIKYTGRDENSQRDREEISER